MEQSKEEVKQVEVPIPVFLTESDIQKMIYIIYNQDLPQLKVQLDELIKLAKQ